MTSTLAAARGWSSLTVVTATYHLTRARILFNQCFDGRLTMVEAPVHPNSEHVRAVPRSWRRCTVSMASSDASAS